MGGIHSRVQCYCCLLLLMHIWVALFEPSSFNLNSRNNIFRGTYILVFSNSPDDDHVNPTLRIQLQFLLETMNPEIIRTAIIAGDASTLREYLTKCPHEVATYVYIVLASFSDLHHAFHTFHIASYKKLGGGLGMTPLCAILSPHLNTCNSTGEVCH